MTIEDKINEGSLTPLEALRMGYRWEAVVTGGDPLAIRNDWLKNQKAAG